MANSKKLHKKPDRYTGLLTDLDIHLFKEGSHFTLYEKLGSHLMTIDGADGATFAVWAPNAKRVSVIGDFNGWNPDANHLIARWDQSGIWEGFIPGIRKGDTYKYAIAPRFKRRRVEKGDPFAIHWETPPRTGTKVWEIDYDWGDNEWMETRARANSLNAPSSTYEVHLGSWRRVAEEGNRHLSYRELAHQLADYVKWMGYTHVELLPVMEHPFYGSWGYQTTGYFAPTSRFGAPEDFAYLVDRLHQNGIGVILDWVPSHFPGDEHGLAHFDGTYLYEHKDWKQGYHPDWNSYIFNYGRNEVRSFIISSALFWFDKFHIDGIRVDAVASMLYLDYSRQEGEWVPNEHGGRENLGAIAFLKTLNERIYAEHPDTQTIAEESTSWPMVSRPLYVGGLGFGMKWNMGWMHDTLKYFSHDPIHRKYHHGQITFSIWYAFTENFVLSISHDEVTYGKGSLINKMPGDEWQKRANMRLFFGFMFAHPGKKLHFMGCEFGQWKEWSHEASCDWHLCDQPEHRGIQLCVRDLNNLYRTEPALNELDFANEGFEGIDMNDVELSTLSFLRRGKSIGDIFLIACNFTPVPRPSYRLGVPRGGFWREVLNSDAAEYGGSGLGNYGGVEAEAIASHNREFSISITLPPLGVVFLKNNGH